MAGRYMLPGCKMRKVVPMGFRWLLHPRVDFSKSRGYYSDMMPMSMTSAFSNPLRYIWCRIKGNSGFLVYSIAVQISTQRVF
jgi:hypothetical protein